MFCLFKAVAKFFLGIYQRYKNKKILFNSIKVDKGRGVSPKVNKKIFNQAIPKGGLYKRVRPSVVCLSVVVIIV